jgi:hypothetical protein
VVPAPANENGAAPAGGAPKEKGAGVPAGAGEAQVLALLRDSMNPRLTRDIHDVRPWPCGLSACAALLLRCVDSLLSLSSVFACF